MGKFGVDTVPAVVILPSGNVSLPFELDSFEPHQAIRYDGDIKSMEELSHFLEQHSPAKRVAEQTAKKPEATAKGEGLNTQGFCFPSFPLICSSQRNNPPLFLFFFANP